MQTSIKPRGAYPFTISSILSAGIPMLSPSLLESRTNQRGEDYYYSPFGTYVVNDLDHNGPNDAFQLRFMAGYVDDDSWHQNMNAQPIIMAERVASKQALRMMMEDILRRWKETPPIVDPELYD